MILPHATLGIVGGGQLGRMFVMAARTMGYEVVVLDPDPDSPAAQFASHHLRAAFTDTTALDWLGRHCRAVTTEFENVPAQSLEQIADLCFVRPAAFALAVTQDRIREKQFLQKNDFSITSFAVINSLESITDAMATIQMPALMKISRSGYDGKGQRWVENIADVRRCFEDFGAQPCVLEERVAIQTEVSVVLARGTDGRIKFYAPSENLHRNGILEMSIVPARIAPAHAQQVVESAARIADLLDYCGVLAVEYFITQKGVLLVNEIAPRPHNTGHYSLDACRVSQFEQQVRALCGLPLGDTTLLCPAAMVNVLGDLWHAGLPPAWDSILRNSKTKFHWYGKQSARPGRKMAHYTYLGDTIDEAVTGALAIQDELQHVNVSLIR